MLCPPHLQQLVKDTFQNFDDAWLLSALRMKSFLDSGKACLDRLQGFALS